MQENKKNLILIALIATLVALFVLTIIGGYELHWSWTGFEGTDKTDKTLYDWLQLLIIPVVIAIVGLWFSHIQKSNEQNIANDNQKEDALQGYINEMSKLLLENNLRNSNPEDEVSVIGRVRTLTVLRRLDEHRKRAVLEFLYESGLIQKGKCAIKLNKASFRGVDLYKIDLHNADLRGVLFQSADLGKANLSNSDLSETNLLRANLTAADLTGADLSNTNIKWAYTSKAKVTIKQLEKAKPTEYTNARINYISDLIFRHRK